MRKLSLSVLLVTIVTLTAIAKPTPRILFYDDADQQSTSSLYQALMNAELVKPLNLTLTAEEQASQQLVFGLKTTELQEVTLTLTEASSQTVVAQRTFEIKAGDNYKALNIANLPDGQYILCFTRDNKKVMKLIGIVHEEE